MLEETDSWGRMPWEINRRRKAKSIGEVMSFQDTWWNDETGKIRKVLLVVAINSDGKVCFAGYDGKLKNVYIIWHTVLSDIHITKLSEFEKWRHNAIRIY